MKKIVLFGAGKSASVLINYLLAESISSHWKIIIADANKKLVEEKTNNHPNAIAVGIDITNEVSRKELIEQADIVISMMPPALHILIARDCVQFSKHLLTASYADEQISSLEAAVKEKGILFLCEMGLDPGIDHMSAMQLLDEIKEQGGNVKVFKSHCGGLVAPESDNNPWHYKISWNPRNIVLAGKAGAIYRENNVEVSEKYEGLFDAGRIVFTGDKEVPELSYYPNRNSLPYIQLYGLENAGTFIRTTLRYKDFMYGWKNIVDLKLTDETDLYETDQKSLQEFFREHLQKNGFGEWLDEKLSTKLQQSRALLDNMMKIMEAEEKAALEGEMVDRDFMLVDADGHLKNVQLDEVKATAANVLLQKMHEANLIMKQLFYLGLDDAETMINKGTCTAADVLQFALEKKLALQPGDKDMIVMLHEIIFLDVDNNLQSLQSSLFVKGDDHIHTAMAKTVGLPLGIAAKLILEGKINLSGIHIPVSKAVYEPVLDELKLHGISFVETRKTI